MTLRPPFRGRDHRDTLTLIITSDPARPRAIDPRIPRDLETIALKCLRRDPSARYRTAEALAQDLNRFARGAPIEAQPELSLEIWRRRLLRHRRAVSVAAVVIVLLSACAGLFVRLNEARRAEDAILESRVERRIVGASLQVLRAEWTLGVLRAAES